MAHPTAPDSSQHGLTSGDFVNNRSGRVLGHVVDDNLGAERRVHDGVGSSKSSSSASDDDDLAVKADWLGLGVVLQLLALFKETQEVRVGDVLRVRDLAEVVNLGPAGLDLVRRQGHGIASAGILVDRLQPMRLTAAGVKVSSVLNTAPFVRSQRRRAK